MRGEYTTGKDRRGEVGMRGRWEGRVGRDEISSKQKRHGVQSHLSVLCWCSQSHFSRVLVVSGVIQVWITTGDQKLSGHQILGPSLETGTLKRECVLACEGENSFFRSHHYKDTNLNYKETTLVL